MICTALPLPTPSQREVYGGNAPPPIIDRGQVEAYLTLGNEVYRMDDLSTGILDNIKHLQEHAEHRGRLFVTIDTVLNIGQDAGAGWPRRAGQ